MNELILREIRNEETVILIVVPCSQDLAAVKAIQLARSVDPHLRRTMLVFTKPDLCDEPHAKKVKDYFRGAPSTRAISNSAFVVRNATEDELLRLPLEEIRARETAFFESSASPFQGTSVERLGIDGLRNCLSTYLRNRIKAVLPDIQRRLLQLQMDANERNQGLGTPVVDIGGSDASIKSELSRVLETAKDAINRFVQPLPANAFAIEDVTGSAGNATLMELLVYPLAAHRPQSEEECLEKIKQAFDTASPILTPMVFVKIHENELEQAIQSMSPFPSSEGRRGKGGGGVATTLSCCASQFRRIAAWHRRPWMSSITQLQFTG